MDQIPAAAVVAERDVILDELARAWNGDAWHGDSLRAVLRGVTAEQAAARPIPGAHSIGELVLHLAAWSQEVARRLADRVAREPAVGDWRAFASTEAAWQAALAELAEAHAALVAAVEAFPPADLPKVIGDEVDPPPVSGTTYGVMLHGLSQHYAYHGGQIAILKKSFG